LGLGKESLANAAGGQTSATTVKGKSVVLFNPKNAKQNQTIVIAQVTAAGDFTIPAKVCVGPLAPGQKCTVRVSFVPNGTGLRKGALTIESNARNGTQTVSLSGTGVKAKSH